MMTRIGTAARKAPALAGLHDEFAAAVIDGLSRPRKSLPCHYFYDARGSELFERITELPEYYPTRTETAILARHARAMMADIGDDGVLVELGSGSSRKTELLLDVAPPGVAYVPIDVSASALSGARQRLAVRYPRLDIRPLLASFMDTVRVPADLADRPRTVFFPGSTIGNLLPGDAVALLARLRTGLPERGRLIIGVDLKKDARQLVLAYNDAAGVTAAFNLNLLARINRELGSAIDLATFRHEAIYDPRAGRIEMHLISTLEQTLQVCGRRIHFDAGESIHTENSHKYSLAEFQALARRAGWTPRQVWTDEGAQFSVHEVVAGK
jgi:dimethylhistidine N-methyltransferase